MAQGLAQGAAMEVFLGIDIGTSAVKAVLVDRDQRLLAEAARPVTVLRPRPLWSEQDPAEWWRAALAVVGEVRERAGDAFAGLEAIGLSGQQHSATLIGRDGAILRPAILWNDGRCGAECREIEAREPEYRRRSGNAVMPGFTAPKLAWVAKHEPEVFAATAKVLLPKDVVRWRLTGAFVSDVSDSAGTLWMDPRRRDWDAVLLDACGMRRDQMPDLVEGSEVSAYLSDDLAAAWGLSGRRIPIAGGAGDNPASAVGMGAVAPGDGFLSLGTSGVLFASTDRPVTLPERTLHSFCHALPGRWHGMAVTLSAASALGWVAALTGRSEDIPGFIAAAADFASDPVRREAAPLFLPYITGERTPHNDPEATGTFAGLRAEHGSAALGYAALEGVAFAFADCLDVMRAAAAAAEHCMVVGGGARSAVWSQMLADVLGIELALPVGAETGAAFGAARLGMLAAGAGDVASICVKPPIRRTFRPTDRDANLLAARREAYRGLYRAR